MVNLVTKGHAKLEISQHHVESRIDSSVLNVSNGTRCVNEKCFELERLKAKFAERIVGKSRFTDDNWFARVGRSVRPRPVSWGNGHLEKDILAVCGEAGLSASAGQSILAAAQRKLIPSNPGIILSLVVRCLALSEVLGASLLNTLFGSWPSVLNHHPNTLHWHYESLTCIFPPKLVPRMICKAPPLLMTSPFTIWGNLEALCTLLDLTLEEATTLSARHPRLLLHSPETLRHRFKELAELLYAPHARMARVLRREPSLLAYNPDTLAENVEAAGEALQLHRIMVVRIFLRQPALLMLAPSTLAERCKGLSDVLGVTGLRLATTALKQPALLSLAPATLRAKCSALGEVIGVSDSLGLSIAGSVPSLLTLSLSTLATKSAALAAAVEHVPKWRQQYLTASAHARGSWLVFSMQRYDRLHFLKECHPDSIISSVDDKKYLERNLEPRLLKKDGGEGKNSVEDTLSQLGAVLNSAMSSSDAGSSSLVDSLVSSTPHAHAAKLKTEQRASFQTPSCSNYSEQSRSVHSATCSNHTEQDGSFQTVACSSNIEQTHSFQLTALSNHNYWKERHEIASISQPAYMHQMEDSHTSLSKLLDHHRHLCRSDFKTTPEDSRAIHRSASTPSTLIASVSQSDSDSCSCGGADSGIMTSDFHKSEDLLDLVPTSNSTTLNTSLSLSGTSCSLGSIDSNEPSSSKSVAKRKPWSKLYRVLSVSTPIFASAFPEFEAWELARKTREESAIPA